MEPGLRQGPAQPLEHPGCGKGDGLIFAAKTDPSPFPIPAFYLSALIILTIAVFFPVHRHGFVNIDDGTYVTSNARLRGGLTWEAASWAFTATRASNWHPLTWISHLLDVRLFGLNPGGHHLMSLGFHAANAGLLFLVLWRMTGALCRSWVTAALFAVHPLHVESVAWIAERKDVLSTVFWLLTMLAYLRHARRPSLARYLPVALAFAAGLLAKPMLITLPLVLLLLDFWPLGRRESASPISVGRLVGEKVPLLVLSAVSGIVTFLVQRQGGATASMEFFSAGRRLANALISYVTYIGKTLWPRSLSIFYPYPEQEPLFRTAGACFILLIISLLVLRYGRKRPFLVLGWLWYLGTLVPVIGLVQVGMQGMADRYTYVPLVGLFILAVWGIPGSLPSRGWYRRAPAVFAVVALTFFSVLARIQVGYWSDSINLFEHALAVTSDNNLAYNNLGAALAAQGKYAEALSCFNAALRIKPHFNEALNNQGALLARQGRLEEATAYYLKVLNSNPDNYIANYSLGNALALLGRSEEAIFHYRQALRKRPDAAEVYFSLGNALQRQGKTGEAGENFSRARSLNPEYRGERSPGPK